MFKNEMTIFLNIQAMNLHEIKDILCGHKSLVI
jgi:hypothetical protein